MYWIPFLAWLVEQGLGGQRIVVVSRGGAGLWYRHLTSRYVDILDLLTPDEFRERTAGKKKQYDSRREIDKELLKKTRRSARARGRPGGASVRDVPVVRRAVAKARRRSSWSSRSHAFQSLTRPSSIGAACRPAQRLRRREVLFQQGVSGDSREQGVHLGHDSHDQPPGAGGSSEHHGPARRAQRLPASVRLRCVRRRCARDAARRISSVRPSSSRAHAGFVGTYGGFSYLAPFYGVPSLSFFSRRGFEAHHLDLAHRVFDRMLPGGFRRARSARRGAGGSGVRGLGRRRQSRRLPR